MTNKTMYLSKHVIIVLVLVILPVYLSERVYADDTYWHKYYLLGKFVNSNPPKPDQIFVFQYRTLNGYIDTFKGLSDSQVVAKVNSMDNAHLEIKFPRNYPYTNQIGNKTSAEHMTFAALADGSEINGVTTKIEDCFTIFSIPFRGKSEVEFIWYYIDVPNLPYHGDSISSSCNAKTIISYMPPLEQINAGVDLKNVTCTAGFVIMLHPTNNMPSCVKPDTANILIERGWAKALQ